MNIQTLFEKYNQPVFDHVDENKVKTLWTFISNNTVLCTSSNETITYKIDDDKIPSEIKNKLEIKALLLKMNNIEPNNDNKEDAFRTGIDKINELNNTNKQNVITSRDPRLKLLLNRKKQDKQNDKIRDIEKQKEEEEEKLRKEVLSNITEHKKRELEEGEVVKVPIKKQKNINPENNYNRNDNYDKRNDNYNRNDNYDKRNDNYNRNDNYDKRNDNYNRNNNYDRINDNYNRNNNYDRINDNYNRNNNYDRRNDNYNRNNNYDGKNMFDINVDSEMKLRHRDYSTYFGSDFRICDLFQSCKYCEKMNKNKTGYHKFENCNQICTDQRCVNKKIHDSYDCPFRPNYDGLDVDAIKYNVATFMFKKFNPPSKFKKFNHQSKFK